MKKIIAVILMTVLSVMTFAGFCFKDEKPACPENEAEAFIRVDRDDFDAWKRELDNVRILTEGEYELKALDDRELAPSVKGFDTLNISGSAQFSVEQFGKLADTLKKFGKTVYIVDTRLESHGFASGIGVSWCGEANGANIGKTLAEVEADEKGKTSLIGSSITAYTAVDDEPDQSMTMNVASWQTERELVENAGFNYLRLICPDHGWPSADVIDTFIEFVKGIDKDNTWLHFHCQAGKGRTGAFMTIYDMMKNPDVAVEDILLRQAMTGSGNLYDRSKPESTHAQKERCVMARVIYNYIQENHDTGYAVKWSEWLNAHSQKLTLCVGCKNCPDAAFSSDTQVVDDTFTAVGKGQATVLAGDKVYFVTVE